MNVSRPWKASLPFEFPVYILRLRCLIQIMTFLEKAHDLGFIGMLECHYLRELLSFLVLARSGQLPKIPLYCVSFRTKINYGKTRKYIPVLGGAYT